MAADIENEAKEEAYEKGKERFRKHVALAKEKKDLGNKAYDSKNSEAAVALYDKAISYLDKEFHRFTPESDAVKQEATKLKVVCHANYSAARLLGETESPQNAEKAVEDAEKAIHLDRLYIKGFVA